MSETFIVSQIELAINAGYEVTLLVKNYKEENTGFYAETFKKYNLAHCVLREDYKIPSQRHMRILTWFKLLFQNLNTLFYVLRFYKDKKKFPLSYLYQFNFYKQFQNTELIHIQYGTNKAPLDILKKIGFLKSKIIVSFHGHDAFFPINGFIQQKGYYDYLFEVADLIHVNTPYLEQQLIKIGADRVKILDLPVSVDTEFFRPEKKKNTSSLLRLLTVGRLDEVKGHRFAIEIVSLLREQGVEVVLNIIGEGDQRQYLENLIDQKSLKDQVFLYGRKNAYELRRFYNNHDILLFTSVALPGGRKETQGLVLGEAQACGLPVVAFDSGGVKYTFKDGFSGFLCEEGNVHEMKNKILELNENPKLRQVMGTNAVNFVKNYNAREHVGLLWSEIYRNLQLT